MKCNQEKRLITGESHLRSSTYCILFALNRVMVLNFTFASLVYVVWASWMADFMTGYGPPSVIIVRSAQAWLSLAVQKGADTERMQTTDLCFLAKKQTINSWRQAQITTRFGCCGKGAWPEITGLSVPRICYDIEGLVANMKQGVDGNTSHMVFHILWSMQGEVKMFQDFFSDLLSRCSY